MPPKIEKNTLIMVTNVGLSSLEQYSSEDEPFIDKAKYAMKMLVLKKLFLQPEDEVSIITMGDETSNSEDMNYVREYSENLTISNWEMVKYIDDLSSTKYPCNWIEAVYVALCFIKREVVNQDRIVFLVIFNNFKEDPDSIADYDPDNIIADLNTYENVHILFVGENMLDESSQTKDVSPSEEFALSVIKQTQAQYEQINNFIESRKIFIPSPMNAIPWKFNLEWNGLNITCSSNVKVTDKLTLGSWKEAAVKGSIDLLNDRSNNRNNASIIKEEVKEEIEKERVQLDVHRNEIPLANTINGYKYGTKYIPFSDDDELAMKYSGSEKGMQIYGFIPQEEVQLELWTGSGSRLIFPETDNDAEVFYCLVQAMVNKRYVAIVRKVYANNSSPKMGVLFPKVEDDVSGLVHIELPFVNDLREIKKRPILSLDNTVYTEKLDALDKFIDSMTMTDNEPEYLNSEMFPNVGSQYHWNAITDRILNPKGSLLPLNDYLKKLLEPPDYLNNQVEAFNELLYKCFGNIRVSKESSKDETLIQVVSPTIDEEDKINVNKLIPTGQKDQSQANFDSEDLSLSRAHPQLDNL